MKLPLIRYAGSAAQGLGTSSCRWAVDPGGSLHALLARVHKAEPEQMDFGHSRMAQTAENDQNSRTTLPSQCHSVGFCLGRKNRPRGGFCMSGAGFRAIIQGHRTGNLLSWKEISLQQMEDVAYNPLNTAATPLRPSGSKRNLGGFLLPAIPSVNGGC